jgi:hypothetical protein
MLRCGNRSTSDGVFAYGRGVGRCCLFASESGLSVFMGLRVFWLNQLELPFSLLIQIRQIFIEDQTLIDNPAAFMAERSSLVSASS